jgi:aminomethyltransferase
MPVLKRTPLFEVYVRHTPRLIDFGGWELPVQFAGINEEHLAVRARAGIFDVSHMGELTVRGPGALAFLQRVTCNDVGKIAVRGAQYSAILNPDGGIIDDIFIYRLGPEDFFLCVNAANADRDYAWLAQAGGEGYTLKNESVAWAQVALQGPQAPAIYNAASGHDFLAIPRHNIVDVDFQGVPVLVARSGYTGEVGPEIFIPAAQAVKVWEALIAAGEQRGLVPAGLGARDTLRLEMGYPLHGHDIRPDTTPLEADLAWIVALDKGDFIGRDALVRQQAQGIARQRVGMVMQDHGIPRDGYRIVAPHGEGKVTSGTKTPSVDQAIAMGYVPVADAAEGTIVEVDIRGKLKKARVAKPPFYRKAK